jgi:hypothetical protein
MTIGIVVRGRRAGLAAFRALEAVERIGRGSIGGFVSFAALTTEGVVRATTQRGGTRTLFVRGDRTGVEPPPPIAEAEAAALMSSGPDRPEPLAQFVAAADGVGLVSGHRVPNRPGLDGRSLLESTLARLAAGADARAAVEAETARNPDADAGLIALDVRGGLFAGNTALVRRRHDLGDALLVEAATGHGVAVLHNTIYPIHGLAALAAGVALDAMDPPDRVDLHVRLADGVPLALGAEPALLVDADGGVGTLVVARSDLLRGRHAGGLLGYRAAVRLEDKLIGHVVETPFVVVEDGRTVTEGRTFEIAVQRARRSATH